MVTRFLVVIISQSIQIASHCVIHLKLTCNVNYTSKKKSSKKTRIKTFISYSHTNTIKHRQLCYKLSIHFTWIFVDTVSLLGCKE